MRDLDQFLRINKLNPKAMKKKLILPIAAIILASGLNAQTLVKVDEDTRTITISDQSPQTFTGYFNITDMGMIIGSPNNSRVAPFSFMTINGMHFTEQFSAGLGIGVEFPSGSYMPIVLDTRYYFRNTPFSPFLNLYGGYALPLDDNYGYYGNTNYYTDEVRPYYNDEPYAAKGGIILNPGFGIRSMFGENFGVIFTVGYRFQRLYYKADKDRQMFTDFNRLSIKIGITFR